MLRIVNAIFDKLIQAELSAVLNRAENDVSNLPVIDPLAFEVPELIAEALFAFKLVIDTTNVQDLASIRTKARSTHRARAV